MKENNTIVTVASYGGPYSGNFIPSLLAFNNIVHEMGYRSVFIFPRFTESYSWVPKIKESSDRVCFIPYKPYSLDNISRIKNICRKEKAILVYSRMSGWEITARFAMPGLPQIWHMEMGLDISSKHNRLKYWLKYRVFGFGKTFHIAVSDSVTKSINSFGVKYPCIWLPNAILFSRLHKKPQYQYSDPIRLLIFAYDPLVKGLDLALDACELLNANETRFVLLVSAQEPTHCYLLDRYGDSFPEWIEILEPTNDISSVYDRADIIISASRSEGFPYALTEAIYSGLPAVISDIPGTSWATEMKMVKVFPSGDHVALANKIEELASEPVSEESQEYNRKIINEKYSLRTWSESIRFVVEHALK